MIPRPIVIAAVLAVAAPASAASISGTITAQAGGAPVAGAEVRIWTQGPKGWVIHQTVAASATGTYAFTVAAGSYKVDARGPAGSGANYGDRWLDIVPPVSGGYIGEDADVLVLNAATVLTGANIALEILGGADGTVYRPGPVEAASMWVRMERRSEPRIHHNDFTKALPAGLVSMRGMVPATDYQIMVYDPSGQRDTLLAPGPYAIVSNAVGALPNLTMVNTPADPNEGNNTANCGAASINMANLRMTPSVPWSSAGARIAPLGDVDWYCFTAVDGDRMFMTATTELTFAGATRRHPWTDPMVSLWRGARVTRLVENDDGGGGYDARIDTGPLTAGCHCVAVTTFGDASYVGSGQTSTGAYQLRVTMGNRPPVPSIRKGTTEVPPAPATFSIDEGDTLNLTLSYVDADGDVPTKAFVHLDAGGAPVTTGTVTLGATSGTYVWQAPADAAAGSPYTLRLDAGDSEFDLSKTVILVVNAVDMAPPAPTLVAPIGGAVVSSGAPTLSWQNVTDPDGDAVTYDLELYAGDTGGLPVQTATAIAAAAGATTTFVPSTIAENTRVWWRVRARGGAALSPWSEYGAFLVDTANDPPEVPILVKPAEGELLAMRRPGLSVLNVTDPEDDAIGYVFAIARDGNFTDVVWTSDPVPANLVSATTMTSAGVDLAWGGSYFARARARDARGGESEWSDARRFRLKQNAPPGTPAWDGACVATTYDQAPPTAIVVRNVDDPEGEQVTFELELFRFDDDPTTSFPVYTASAVMELAGTVTPIPVDLSGLANGRYRYRVRAFDGTDASDTIECELTLDLTEGEPAGGCCQTGGAPRAPLATALLVALTGLGLAAAGRRRRRRVTAGR